MRRRGALATLSRGALLVAAACSRTPGPGASASASAPGPSAPPAAASAASCGALECRLFDSPEAAFRHVLELQPQVLAIGETHAQRGLEGIPSTTRRFTEALLPALSGRASDLVVEIWVADGSCGQQEKQVARQQRDVTVTQAPTNQNEFVTLGHAARRHGIVPHVLRPSCEEYARIVDAGAGDVATMLEMIARLTAEKIRRLLRQPPATGASATSGGAHDGAAAPGADAGAARMVVAYGGAMHNDVAPRPGREAWSFGPALHGETAGRYVELDLIVPEYVKDTEAWRSLPWYPHFDRASHPGKTKLYRPGPASFVLVFPSAPPVDAGAAGPP